MTRLPAQDSLSDRSTAKSPAPCDALPLGASVSSPVKWANHASIPGCRKNSTRHSMSASQPNAWHVVGLHEQQPLFLLWWFLKDGRVMAQAAVPARGQYFGDALAEAMERDSCEGDEGTHAEHVFIWSTWHFGKDRIGMGTVLPERRSGIWHSSLCQPGAVLCASCECGRLWM